MKNLTDFEKILGYIFKNQALLKEALTHKSTKNRAHNERLEFLGDAVLDLVIADFLFKNFPKKPEGELSKLRASLVNERSFAKFGEAILIPEFLQFSLSLQKNGGKTNENLISSAFEAVIGAVFLDAGLEMAKKISLKLLEKIFPKIDENLLADFKTRLQEVTQNLFKTTPEYRTVREFGPDHNKIFCVVVLVNGEEFASAQGASKKIAQQKCAKIALKILKK